MVEHERQGVGVALAQPPHAGGGQLVKQPQHRPDQGVGGATQVAHRQVAEQQRETAHNQTAGAGDEGVGWALGQRQAVGVGAGDQGQDQRQRPEAPLPRGPEGGAEVAAEAAEGPGNLATAGRQRVWAGRPYATVRKNIASRYETKMVAASASPNWLKN